MIAPTRNRGERRLTFAHAPCHRCQTSVPVALLCAACADEVDAAARVAPLTRPQHPYGRSRLLLAIGIVAEEAVRCGMGADDVAGRVAFATEAERLARELERTPR